MAQHDYNLANQSGADFRADLNNALSAIATTNSGATSPSTTFAHQLWIDTANSVLKIRNSANDAWITTGVSITADNTFTGNITGNASTATALETARTINGTSFDGTANISFDTDSVSEGSSNLYFTNARVESYLDAGTSTPTFASAVINSSITGTAVLDDDTFATASATTVATSESIKAYVDSQVGSVDTLAEILLNGNTTGGTDIEVSTGDDITFADSSKAIFGTGSDLSIYHDGSNSYIQDSGTGNLLIQAETSLVLEATNGQNYLTANKDGNVSLYYSGSNKLYTTNTGINVTGTVTSDGLTVDGDATIGADSSVYDLTLSSSAPILRFSDTSFSATHYINSNNGEFRIMGDAVVSLSTNNARRLRVESNGDIAFMDDTGTSQNLKWDASADSLNFVDNAKATFGDSDDLQIYHDGSNSYIAESGTGSLFISGGANVKIQSPSDEDMIIATANGAVTLYHNNSAKLATTNTGIDVTGTVTADGLTVDGVARVNDSEFLIADNSTSDTAKISMDIDTTNGARIRSSINGTATIQPLGFYTGSTKRLNITSGGDISFYDDTGTTQGLFWDASTERLGIGTTSPSELLHIYNTGGAGNDANVLIEGNGSGVNAKLTIDGHASGGQLDLTYRSDTQSKTVAMRCLNDGSFRIDTLGSEAMRIVGNDVGIGTSSPKSLLNVTGTGADGGILTLENDSGSLITDRKVGQIHFYSNDGSANGTGVKADIKAIAENSIGSEIGLAFGTSDTSSATAVEAMRISANGSVGIGTDSPSAKLEISDTQPTLRLTDTAAGSLGTAIGSLEFYSEDTSGNYPAVGAAIKAITESSFGSGHGLALFTNADATSPSERVRISQDGNVGIGTSSPNYLLDVEGSGSLLRVNSTSGNSIVQLSVPDTTSITGVNFGDSGSTNAGYIWYRHTGDSMAFTTAGSEAMRILSSGNVGIGTSSPSELLTVNDGNLLVSNTDTPAKVFLKDSRTTSNSEISQRSDGRLSLAAVAGSYGTTGIEILQGGNVGIGTASPLASLHIIKAGLVNQFRVSNTASDATTKYGAIVGSHYTNAEEPITGMLMTSSSSVTGGSVSIGGGISSANAVNNILFYTAANNTTLTGSERMRIDSSGNLLVGTTVGYGGLINVPVTTTDEAMVTQSDSTSASTHLHFRNPNGFVGSISTNGSATAYNTSSDARLKDVTGEARGLEVITKLNPVAYNWKADGKADEGLIAQEVKEIVPNAVSGSEDEHYQMDYSKLVTPLVKAVQELEQQVTKLKSEIAKLKGE